MTKQTPSGNDYPRLEGSVSTGHGLYEGVSRVDYWVGIRNNVKLRIASHNAGSWQQTHHATTLISFPRSSQSLRAAVHLPQSTQRCEALLRPQHSRASCLGPPRNTAADAAYRRWRPRARTPP